MLDICMPIHVANIPQCVIAIEALTKLTDVPHRFILVIDGGTAGDRAAFIQYLATENFQRYVHINDATQGFASCMATALSVNHGEYLAIAPPHIVLEDPKWFGKMQEPFLKDQRCMLVTAEHRTICPEMVPPFKVQSSRVALWSEFALLRRKSMLEVIPVDGGPEDYIKSYAIKAEALGGTVWCEPSIRYGYAEHTAHANPSFASARKESRPRENSYSR